MVFSHGWPLSADSWGAQMLFLASTGFRCIAHDRSGHDRSSQPWSVSRRSPRRISPKTSRSSMCQRWLFTATMTRSYRSEPRLFAQPNWSGTRPRRSIRSHLMVSPSHIKTGLTPTCWRSLRRRKDSISRSRKRSNDFPAKTAGLPSRSAKCATKVATTNLFREVMRINI